MDFYSIFIVCIVSFIASIVGVSIGGTSLITIPVLIWLGMIPNKAVATNMFALIFLSISGTIGFRKQSKVAHHKLIFLFVIITIAGSFIGANIVAGLNADILRRVIAIVICLIAGSFILKKDLGIQEKKQRLTVIKLIVGTLLVFILGIYGGFFSGGYVTLLSYVFILIFGFNFLQTAFITKVFNTFSSLVACILFYHYELIDFSIGIPLAISMFFGALYGSKMAILKGNKWIRNLFIIFAVGLATKLIFF
ncbi:MAG: TSUP family transporter [Candidatus Omnitrophica bacterium]|nr:TSUP family transporter [Candidatus Omnitrophota bacterium]MBU2251247.1 TSUP family transporter [Candidatus Omnitrophota bacterium]MBU2474276.1 TSUP family transporter [Candidatus Omnitrophota bacterium]